MPIDLIAGFTNEHPSLLVLILTRGLPDEQQPGVLRAIHREAGIDTGAE